MTFSGQFGVGGGTASGGGGGAPTGPAGGDLAGTYPAPTVNDGADGSAIHDDVAGEIAAVAIKVTPVGSDLILLEDSADGNNKKRATLASLAGAPVIHAATHENGGLDEVNVAGLSGLLADPQTPAGHAFAGGEHTVSTLADVNAKISDATLIDTADFRLSDARTPTGSAGGQLAGTYPNPTVVDGADGSAIHGNVAAEISIVAEKVTPVGADLLLVEDSAAANAKKRVQIANLPGLGDLSSILSFGSSSVQASTTTRYLSPSTDRHNAPTVLVEIRVPRAGTLRNLHLLHTVPAGNGNQIVYTALVNGVASALAVSLASTGSTAQDTANSVTVSQGDRIALRVTKASSIGNGSIRPVATMELT